MQLFRKQATAVALDGLCQAGLCSISKIGYWLDVVGKRYLGECGVDPFCASKLGPDPVASVRQAISRADSGTCAGLQGIDGSTLRQLYTMFLGRFEFRVLVPSTAFRIVRCNADDVVALQTFGAMLSKMFGGGGFRAFGPKEDLSSNVLGMHIALSELEETPPPTLEQLTELMKDPVFSKPDGRMRAFYDQWPRYAHDAWVGKYPDVEIPLLLLNGTLDPATPQDFADTIAPHYARPGQRYVLLPRAAHGTLYQSPTGKPPAEACGMTVFRQFSQSPLAPSDTSCKDKILQHDFEHSPEVAQAFFGRPSLWEPPPLLANASFAALSPARMQAITHEVLAAARETELARFGERARWR
jgi:hypothetical protein